MLTAKSRKPLKNGTNEKEENFTNKEFSSNNLFTSLMVDWVLIVNYGFIDDENKVTLK